MKQDKVLSHQPHDVSAEQPETMAKQKEGSTGIASAESPTRPFEKLSDEALIQRYVDGRLEGMRSESEKNKIFSREMAAIRRLVADSQNPAARKEYGSAMAEITQAENGLERKRGARLKESEELFEEFMNRPGWPENYERAEEKFENQVAEVSKSDPETVEWAFNGFNAYRLEHLNELLTRQGELAKTGEELRQRARELSERSAMIRAKSAATITELRLASVKAEIGTEQDKQHWEEVADTSRKNLEDFDKLNQDHRQYMQDSSEYIKALRILTAELRSLNPEHRSLYDRRSASEGKED